MFAGSPNEVADRILNFHQLRGHSRQILQMNVGGMPQRDVLKAIERLGTEVLPQIHGVFELVAHGLDVRRDLSWFTDGTIRGCLSNAPSSPYQRVTHSDDNRGEDV